MARTVPSPIQDLLDDLHSRVRGLVGGEVATYIPALGDADPSWFGIALATVDGQVYETGDSRVEFTVQSVSKPFVYALALADRGLGHVLERVGVEPTGEAFNAIRLDPDTGHPLNPMVNAGAIVTASLVNGDDHGQQFQRILDGLSSFAGRDLRVDHGVLASEERTGDRNRALGYLLRNSGALYGEVDEALSVYFRQCSILVTAHDLAVMAATLACGGVNPITGKRVVGVDTAEHVMTVMAMCGTYDFAGEWMLRTGLPTKSGVSGGLAAALPSQLGIGLFSPPIDRRGNSVRGTAVCEELAHRFGLHLLRPAIRTAPDAPNILHGDTVSSRRVRRASHHKILRQSGSTIAVCRLQGDLGFAATELAVRTISAESAGMGWLVLDMRRVGRTEAVAVALLDALIVKLKHENVGTVVVNTDDRSQLASAEAWHHTLDAALEWCEDALLAHQLGPDESDSPVPPAEQDLLLGLNPGLVEYILPLLVERHLNTGDSLPGFGSVPGDDTEDRPAWLGNGDPADALCFVTSGSLRVEAPDDSPAGDDSAVTYRRIGAMSAGTAALNLALIDEAGKPYRLAAEEPTLCHVLSRRALRSLEDEHPDVAQALQYAVARELASRMYRAAAENRALLAGGA